MPIVTLDDVGMSYGADDILLDVTAEISGSNRIGLIGPNGTGKSTLLRIIAGIEIPTRGRVERARNLRMAYLPQEPQLGAENTVYQEAIQAFTSIRDMEEELHLLEGQMDDAGRVNQTLDRYHRVLERYEKQGGYTYQSETRSVLSALGFGAEDWDRPVATLSGGEKARAALARVILESPDLMMLDEPTNHLDFAALDWIEAYLDKWQGTLIISTHDRQLLSALPDRIWAVQDGTIRTYRGGYREYLKVHQQEQETLLKRYREQQAYVERTEEFIRRHHAGQKHAQAKDREKKLERLERIDSPHTAHRITFSFDTGSRGPDLVLQARDLAVGFDSASSSKTKLFQCPDLRLYRGDKVALIGPNGSGKTTFLKVLLGEMAPMSGFLDYGMGVQKGSLPQDRGAYLDGSMTLLEALMSGTGLERAEARNMLGRFLFSGDDAFKRLSTLSGGELSRVVLARVAHLSGNLLLLDEPTNHLDIESREVLQEALARYEGTLIMVSHDRYLIDAIATTIWEIRNGILQVFKGGYSFYQQRQQEERLAQEQARTQANGSRSARPSQKRQAPPERAAAQDQRVRQEDVLVREISALEKEVATLETDLADASYGQDHRRIAELHAQHKLKSRLLQEKMDMWAAMERPP